MSSFINPMPPRLSDDKIRDFLLKYYPFEEINLDSIKEFPSYVDRNYYFTANVTTTPAAATNEQQFIVKFLNSEDSSDLGVVDGLMQLKQYLYSNGVNCPRPVQSSWSSSSCYIIMTQSSLKAYAGPDGTLKEVITDPSNYNAQSPVSVGEPYHCVSVLTFVEGHDVSVRHTPKFLYDLGKFIGDLDNKLKGFSHKGLESRDMFYWNLCHFSRLKERQATHVTDENRLKMIDKVFDDFQLYVAPIIQDPSIPRGIIHNDVNPNNIIVVDSHEPADYTINGIIDVCDSVHAPYVCELAIAVSHYMNGIPQPVKYIKPLIHGYLAVFPLAQSTLDVLYYIVLARLTQLYVNGIHSSTINPTNLYISKYNESTWKLIEELVGIGKESCYSEWELV